jgi:hypothetical protein
MSNKKTQNNTFSGPQERAISLLAQGLRITDVAKTVPCGRKTIYQWLEIPEFELRVEHEKGLIIKNQKSEHRKLLGACLESLKKELSEGRNPMKAVEIIYKALNISGDEGIKADTVIILNGQTVPDRIEELVNHLKTLINMLSPDERGGVYERYITDTGH